MPLKHVTITREERPTKPVLRQVRLGNDEWHEMPYSFSKRTAVWKIYNTGVQTVYYAYREKEEINYQELGAGDLISYETVPEELWLRRSVSTSSPIVRFEAWEWENVD